jgi:hypothetical protein
MKILVIRALIIICLYILVPSCAQHGNPWNKISKEANSLNKKSPGKIVFDKEIHYFGTLKDGEIVSFSFLFKNCGESPFRIVKVGKSCGCLEIHYTSEEIAPGESSAIEFILNSAGEWGNLIKEATIETSDGEKKELQIGAYIDNKQFNNN